MTTFEDAARAEAESLFLHSAEVPSPQELGVRMALWARDHLAEQEASDAEVEAAARALFIETMCGDEYAGELWDESPDDAPRKAWHRDLARAALRAAARERRGHA